MYGRRESGDGNDQGRILVRGGDGRKTDGSGSGGGGGIGGPKARPVGERRDEDRFEPARSDCADADQDHQLGGYEADEHGYGAVISGHAADAAPPTPSRNNIIGKCKSLKGSVGAYPKRVSGERETRRRGRKEAPEEDCDDGSGGEGKEERVARGMAQGRVQHRTPGNGGLWGKVGCVGNPAGLVTGLPREEVAAGYGVEVGTPEARDVTRAERIIRLDYARLESQKVRWIEIAVKEGDQI